MAAASVPTGAPRSHEALTRDLATARLLAAMDHLGNLRTPAAARASRLVAQALAVLAAAAGAPLPKPLVDLNP